MKQDILDSFIKAFSEGHIYADDSNSLGKGLDCSTLCESCPAMCFSLSEKNGNPDLDTFKKNFKPYRLYLQQNYPEYFI